MIDVGICRLPRIYPYFIITHQVSTECYFLQTRLFKLTNLRSRKNFCALMLSSTIQKSRNKHFKILMKLIKTCPKKSLGINNSLPTRLDVSGRGHCVKALLKP